MNLEDRLRDYQRRLRPIEKDLRRFKGVRRVDVGYRYVDGERTNRVAVRLFVAGPKAGRKTAKARNLAPKTMAGLAVDVIPFAAARPVAAVELAATAPGPLIGGLAIGPEPEAAITLGAVLPSTAFPGPQIVTSHEVGFDGDPVYQFGLTSSARRPIGRVVNVQPTRMCALVQVDPGLDVQRDSVDGLPPVAGCVEADDIAALVAKRVPLHKFGIGTKHTVGILDGLEASDGSLSLAPAPGGHGPVAAHGDCGAIWMTGGGQAVALQYGIRSVDGHALAQSMHGVRDFLALVIP